MQKIDPHTPVLVGIGIIDQREKDTALALEAVQLMIAATRAAGADSGVPALLQQAQRIYVPQGLWGYSDPARLIARAIAARNATTVYAKIGILQQSLIGDACQRIATGELDCAIVAGGEARYRHLQGQIAGVEVSETAFTESPDEVLTPESELVLDIETSSGLGMMPVGYYAIIESAFRAAHGWSVAEHRDRMARLYSGFSAIALDNPHAWTRKFAPAAEIRDASARNRMLAFPYTKLHNTSWNVDQASAMLFCSAARALELGVPRERWVFPRSSSESNHMLALSQRPELHRLPGARIAGEKALQLAGLIASDVTLLELYSCFPIAVELYAEELGIREDRDWTVTGGMPFAGGPLNNYVLQSTCRMIELMRGKADCHGLVSSVSGYLTKQAFGVWSTEAGPDGFQFADVSAATSVVSPAREVIPAMEGAARICGYTVMHHGDQRVCGVALVDLESGARSMVNTLDQSLMERMESEEMCGRNVLISGGRFTASG